jgi:two-component system, cell cycle sensor histidine kinase and response regulator CckA
VDTDTIAQNDVLKVLVLEDCTRDFEIISEQLIDAGYRLTIERVETEASFAASLRDKSWDIVLADFNLPGFDAFGALRIRNEICPDTPFICVSGSIGEETAIELLKSGAVDYVIKDRPDRLPFAVGRALDEAREKKIHKENDVALKEAYRQLGASQIATLGILEDLKAEVRVRQEREAELQRVSMAVEEAAEVIVITDPEGTIQYANPAFEEVTGYSREEAVGQNPRLLKSGQQNLAFYQDLWGTIAGGRVWKGRMVNKRKDGTFYTQVATISSVRDASGRILNYVAVKRDITEFLRIEEERAKLQEQFLQAQKIESIGRLAGGIAHDFNNMLSIILGFGQLVLDELRPGDPLHGWVKEIMSAGQRSKTLTRQLLAFSRKQTLQPEVLDLNHLVRELEKMLYRLIGEDITLELALAQDIGRVLVDPGQIEQVIMNLVVNARDAMPTGGRLLIETAAVELDDTYTETHPESESGKHVLLAVTDTGCGMSKEILSQIFEPFFTTKKKGRGTGLGLASVYGIVKQSGGTVWVYSEPGQGTTFKIYLPQTQAVEESAVAKPEAAVPVAGGEHILVVEDEEMLRKLMASLLSRLGYTTTLAANGGEALLLVEEKGLKPDLIITDVVMPNMSGKQLIERLRRNHPHLKTLYMSGYTENAIVHHGVLDAGTPFIQKPFNIQDLGAKVQDILRGGRAL